MDATNALADRAVEIATWAARDYLRAHKPAADQSPALPAAIVAEVQAAVPEALADAKEALSLGMGQYAVATFGASMRLAGIRAGKTVLLLLS